MSETTILRERNPAVAEFYEHWKARYQRNYDFSKTEDQADFYEGMTEMARHIATNSAGAFLQSQVSNSGVTDVMAGASLKPAPAEKIEIYESSP
jgi:hypothetical protein